VTTNSSIGNKSKSEKKSRKKWMSKAEMETLKMLEWKKVCQQVASFAETSGGAQMAYRGKLPVGSTYEESRMLLNQTREAMTVSLKFDGIYNIRKAIDAAIDGAVLHPLVLGAIATTLESINRLQNELEAYGQDTICLQELSHDMIGSDEYELIKSIKDKINVGSLDVC